MTTVPVYYAKELLSNAAQIDAAHALLSALLVRQMARGQRLSYLARLWGRSLRGINLASEQARTELAYRERKAPVDQRHLWGIPDPVPLVKLMSNPEVYLPLLDDMEMDAALALADDRTEALIRGMFTDKPQALYFTKQVMGVSKAKKKPAKRKAGRPKGAKNKPKTHDRDDAGWLMPDGRRVQL